MPAEPAIKRTVAFIDGQNLLQQRWLKIACAFPSSPTSRNTRGINGTDWLKIDRAIYDTCLDPRDYRPKPPGGKAPTT